MYTSNVKRTTLTLSLLVATSAQLPIIGFAQNSWVTKGNAPVAWSGSTGKNILWRTPLPEAGQSGIAVSKQLLFLTTMKPLKDATALKQGHDIVGYAVDRKTGKILWTVDLPGTEDVDYAYGFSDSTSPTPLTDGKHVWFYNASGSLGCYDFKGNQVWLRRWKPTTGRPFNKQFEPILYQNTLLNVEPRDEGDPKREPDPWNYLRGIDKTTGKTLWVAEDSLTHYNTPVFGRRKDGTPAVLQGRGGYHDVPETPTGLSLTSLASGQEGKTLWRLTLGGKALQTQHWDARYAYWLDQDASTHTVVDTESGKVIKTQSLTAKVDYRHFDTASKAYVLEQDIDLSKPPHAFKVFPAWFCNIVVQGYHYFLCFTDSQSHAGPPYSLGRVNIDTGKVEYLELPVQVHRNSIGSNDYVWHTPQPSSTVNSRGIDVAGDPRSRRDGWYWCFLGSPTSINDKIYITTMLGITYVIDGKAKVLDAKALLSVNDLGEAGKTWSLNSISYADGRIYHRSLKELLCIGNK